MGRGGKTDRRPGRSETHTLIVDRLVDAETASVEVDGRNTVLVPRPLLPADASPDVVLRVERDATRVTITIDQGATQRERRAGEAVAARLRRRDPGGDVTL